MSRCDGSKVVTDARKSTVIGDLPTDIIHRILEYMPIQNAARMSTLSKWWGQMWSTQPHLVFARHFFQYVYYEGASAASIIHKILMQHTGPILGFHLISYNHKPAQSDLDQCIIFLSKHGIQNLTIGGKIGNYALPYAIFTCSALTHLKLSGCIFKLPPPAFRGFDKLVSLEMSLVTIYSKCFESLISHCPGLEQLVLHDILSDGVIEINAPRLRSFDFIGFIRFISIKNTPLLEKLSVSDGFYLCREKWDIVKFFESLSALQHLHLIDVSVVFFAARTGDVPRRLPFNLNGVKHLCLTSIYLGCLNEVSCALCLMRSFPCLQYLEIQVVQNTDDVPALECLEVESVSDLTFIHLREVKLQGFIGAKPHMQLMKLLLAKSPVLVRMQIEPWIYVKHDPCMPSSEFLYKTVKSLAMISRFQRASPKAEVVYNIEDWLSRYASLDLYIE